MSKIIGIDLGTGFSCVSVMENGTPKVIVNSEGERTTPSIISYKGSDILVGKPAQNVQITNPKDTAFVVKRFIGRKYDECANDIKKMPYEITKGPNGDVRINVGGKERSPEEISAQVLMKLKKAAEDYLGEPVTEAVITTPAYFNDSQRQATKDAGKIAGLEVKRIVNEPTAACLAFGLSGDKDQTILVYDYGSGTLDCSIIESGDGVFEVKSTAGDSQLGGTDFTYAIVDWLNTEFKNDNGINLKDDAMALQRLVEAAEKAKIELSSASATTINIPFITADSTGPKHLNYELTRAKFEQLIEPLLERAKIPFERVLKDANLTISDIDEILFVGGSTRVPAVYNLIKTISGKEPNKSVNPDEVVATGAAIQGAILAGDSGVKDILLLDVTPLSLGIETEGAVMTKMIERNTTVPTEKTQIFSTASDGQTAVTIRVAQGERTMFDQNKVLGSFNLEGIPVAPRGVPQIEVKLSLDANSILTVSAKDLGTGKEQKITITNGSGLSDAEIEAAIKDAEVHAEEDKKIKEKVDTKNAAESAIFGTEKSLKDYGDKLTETEKNDIQKAIDDLKAVKDSEDIDAIKDKTQKLTEASYKLAAKLYQNNTGNSGQSGPSSMPPGFEDILKEFGGAAKAPADADYEIIK